MPDQHRSFFSKQPYLIVGTFESPKLSFPRHFPTPSIKYAGSKLESGEVWASILFGPQGFAWSPDPTILQVSPALIPGSCSFLSVFQKSQRLTAPSHSQVTLSKRASRLAPK
jgi:hypothetical protein